MENNKEINNKNKLIIYLIIVLAILVVLPLLIEKLIVNNNYLSKASNDGWIAFLGSYIGGIIGGMGTLIAMIVTTRETRRIQRKNEEYIIKKDYLEDVKRNKPLLMIKEVDEGSRWISESRFNIGRVDLYSIILFEIKNVGLGIAKDITFRSKSKNKIEYSYNNVLLNGDSIVDLSINFYYFDMEEVYNNKETLIISYRDIFDNLYSIEYDIMINKFNDSDYLKILRLNIEGNGNISLMN